MYLTIVMYIRKIQTRKHEKLAFSYTKQQQCYSKYANMLFKRSFAFRTKITLRIEI